MWLVLCSAWRLDNERWSCGGRTINRDGIEAMVQVNKCDSGCRVLLVAGFIKSCLFNFIPESISRYSLVGQCSVVKKRGRHDNEDRN